VRSTHGRPTRTRGTWRRRDITPCPAVAPPLAAASALMVGNCDDSHCAATRVLTRSSVGLVRLAAPIQMRTAASCQQRNQGRQGCVRNETNKEEQERRAKKQRVADSACRVEAGREAGGGERSQCAAAAGDDGAAAGGAGPPDGGAAPGTRVPRFGTRSRCSKETVKLSLRTTSQLAGSKRKKEPRSNLHGHRRSSGAGLACRLAS
jgi:hypothetical protein